MRGALLTFCFLFFTLISLAQFGPQQIISENASGPIRAIPVDFNGDGFIDIVAAIAGENRISWFQNLDGLGSFGEEQTLIESVAAIQSLDLVDINSDGKLDILYKTNLDIIAWRENIDGQGSFGSENIIANTDYPYYINFSDLDNDGDIDVIANLYHNSFNNRLVFYENIDGLGTFSNENIIDIESFYYSPFVSFDLDNDGDDDIITSYETFGPSIIIWYENIDGQGTFSELQVIHEFLGIASDWTTVYDMAYSDIDNDGKIDLLVSTFHDDLDDYLLWLKNQGGQGNFEDPQYIHTNETSLGSLRTYDIDGDNDQDILVSFFFSEASNISWFENTNGLGDFSPQRIISTEVVRARDATAADFNNDGKLDVASASSHDNKIAWYENTGVLGTEESNRNLAQVYPNPLKNRLHIPNHKEVSQITLFSFSGAVIATFKEVEESIDFTKYASGFYLIQITYNNGSTNIAKLIKE